MTVARTFGLPDQPGRSTIEVLNGFLAGRRILVVLDNCEHLLDATADLVVALLGAAPHLTLLATSREPLGVSGEVTSRVSSLSPSEAMELLTDRARRVHPDFRITDDNEAAATEICSRLDGMPLAIELAAARVRALSLTEIVGSLHDRFRLLTGGTRTAVRRQQTLRASVDWSHALLSEPERILLRRVAAFMGGFDLDAAHAVGGAGDSERYQILDQLLLLVDKSLVIAESSSSQTRYRMLETVRQYALEKLGESGEADAIRCRHRDHYTAMAVALDAPMQNDHEQRVKQVEVEIDNLRSAFEWSCESGDVEEALVLASSLAAAVAGAGPYSRGAGLARCGPGRRFRARRRFSGSACEGRRRQNLTARLVGEPGDRERQRGGSRAGPGAGSRTRRRGSGHPGAHCAVRDQCQPRRRCRQPLLRRGCRTRSCGRRFVAAEPDTQPSGPRGHDEPEIRSGRCSRQRKVARLPTR